MQRFSMAVAGMTQLALQGRETGFEGLQIS